jgi:hypothetical protein
MGSRTTDGMMVSLGAGSDLRLGKGDAKQARWMSFWVFVAGKLHRLSASHMNTWEGHERTLLAS